MPKSHRRPGWRLRRAWNRIHWANLAGTRYGRKAKHPNKPSPVITHVPPTKKPGEGLTGKQTHLHRIMHATVGNPLGWIYTFARPLRMPKRRLATADFASRATLIAALKKITTGARWDCSFAGKAVFYLAGYTDDPTGENWGPWGNTSTTYQHLEKRPGLDNAYHPTAAQLAKCKVGDIGLVGKDGSDHFWIVMEESDGDPRGPLVWADGGPGTSTPNSYRALDDPRRPISVCIPKE